MVEGGEEGEGAVCEVVIWRVFIPFFRVWGYWGGSCMCNEYE